MKSYPYCIFSLVVARVYESAHALGHLQVSLLLIASMFSVQLLEAVEVFYAMIHEVLTVVVSLLFHVNKPQG